jgi:ribosomal subunit interface protein
MESQVQVTFRAIEPSSAITDYVHAKAAKLDTVSSRIIGCRVAIEAPHKHHRNGRHYRVRVDLTIPGRELVVENPSTGPSSEDVYACIDTAFDSAQRLLADHAKERRHGDGAHGTIRGSGPGPVPKGE